MGYLVQQLLCSENHSAKLDFHLRQSLRNPRCNRNVIPSRGHCTISCMQSDKRELPLGNARVVCNVAPASSHNKILNLQSELDGILKEYVGRESPLYFAKRITKHYKRSNGEGPHIYLKRENLNHSGAHKIYNVFAQALVAKKLGKKRTIEETGTGQDAQDMERQSLNVFRMRLLGAEGPLYYLLSAK